MLLLVRVFYHNIKQIRTLTGKEPETSGRALWEQLIQVAGGGMVLAAEMEPVKGDPFTSTFSPTL